MNNEIFDRMIKEGLSKAQVTPSAGLKKTMGRKLFFQNLMVFHKVKVVVAALLIGTTGVLSYTYFNGSEKNMLPSGEISQSEKGIFTDKIIVVKQYAKIKEANNSSKDLANSVNDISSGNSDMMSNSNVDKVDLNSGNQNQNQLADNSLKNALPNNKTKNDGKDINNKTIVSNHTNNSQKNKNLKSGAVENNKNVVNKVNSSIEEELFLANSKGTNLGGFELQSPLSVQEEDISFKKKHIIRRELSIDVYKHLMNDHDIDNNLLSQEHQEFHWDFYKENEALRTQSLGGLDVNYAVGTKTLKGKVSLGVNLTKVIEEKTRYEFDEVTDPIWLEFFNVDELSWINTFGEDTCIQCFSAHNTEELQTELKKDHNEYSYINVPMKIGAEVNMKYVTLDVMAGMQWSRLTNASGLYVKKKTPSDDRLYYWDDLEMSTLNKENEMLKTNHFSWIGSANLRVRLTRQFDLLAGYNMVMSKGNITNDGYLLEKSMKYSQAKIGITFYPNRLPLLKK